MFELLKAAFLGVVEGITEWLPISSTGHLILVEQFIPFKKVSEGFFEMFDVVIQLGAIIAVVILFFPKIWPFTWPLDQKDQKDRSDRKGSGAQREQKGLASYIKMDII